jgi:hypothetical protein
LRITLAAAAAVAMCTQMLSPAPASAQIEKLTNRQILLRIETCRQLFAAVAPHPGFRAQAPQVAAGQASLADMERRLIKTSLGPEISPAREFISSEMAPVRQALASGSPQAVTALQPRVDACLAELPALTTTVRAIEAGTRVEPPEPKDASAAASLTPEQERAAARLRRQLQRPTDRQLAFQIQLCRELLQKDTGRLSNSGRIDDGELAQSAPVAMAHYEAAWTAASRLVDWTNRNAPSIYSAVGNMRARMGVFGGKPDINAIAEEVMTCLRIAPYMEAEAARRFAGWQARKAASK